MKKFHILCLALSLALLQACSSGGGPTPTPTPTPPPAPSVVIEAATEASPAGEPMYLLSSVEFDQIEVRIGGQLVTATDGVGVRGAIYSVPEGLATGNVTLGVRLIGEATDADTRTFAISTRLFEDVSALTGMNQDHNILSEADPCMPISTGVGLGDFDNDGDFDFYLGNLGVDGRMFRNDGDTNQDGLPNFSEATSLSGLTGIDNISAVSFMDYDNDGDKDLFIGRWGSDMLMQNQLMETGIAEFTDVTVAMGLDTGSRRTQGIGWGDYDNDGDLDFYLVRHAHCGLDGFENRNPHDQLFRNDGGGFTDVTTLLGGAGEQIIGLGFAAVWVDSDMDGDQDLLVANDHISDNVSRVNVLWRNDGPDPDNAGGWLFTDVSASTKFGEPIVLTQDSDVRDTHNAMGIAIGDVNRDGSPDVTYTNIGPNILKLNDGAGNFDDVSEAMGVQRTDLPWGPPSITWGTQLLDIDNDMDLDVFYVGGRIDVLNPYPNAMFRNDGMDQPWHDITWEAGITDFNSGKACALVDLDRDGYVEFLVANYGGPLRVYRNLTGDLGGTNHWLSVELIGQGVQGKSNRDAVGAVIQVVTPDGITQTGFRTSKPSLGSGGELACHFGLGANTSVTSLQVTWPNGAVTNHTADAAVDSRIVIQEP